ncbi:MAG: UDP-glucose 4-epimerase GalE [Candidatus Moranbacteria bacterium]|nr:UDP-glucose 4-epimerase GalE [Candidatus Moranbacteria bacterium]
MKKILITGGGGYIGSHVVKFFLERGFSIVVLDNFSRGYREPLQILSKIGSIDVEESDLLDINSVHEVFQKHDIGAVLHFAALCIVNESVEQPELYMKNNVEGTKNLLEVMREANVEKIIFSSTCAVYGEAKILPVDENHSLQPMNPYGESKLAAENLIRQEAEAHNLKYVIFRYFNVCGASSDGMIGDSKKPSQLLVQNAVRGAMDIEPFSYTCADVETPDRTPIRDYIDVEDLAGAHFLGFKYLDQGGASDTFNLGNGKGYSVKEIVSEVERIFGRVMEKAPTVTRKGEHAKIYADPRKAKKALQFMPKKSLTESIESLRKWYTGHPNGYKE